MSQHLNLDKFFCLYFLNSLIAAQMNWFLYESNLTWYLWSSRLEEAHHKPSIVILSLCVQSYNLSSHFEMRNRIIVAAGNLSRKGVDSQPTSLSIGCNFIISLFDHFDIGQTSALIACWVSSIYSIDCLEHASYFGHLC